LVPHFDKCSIWCYYVKSWVHFWRTS
jgi:hypothetical protein